MICAYFSFGGDPPALEGTRHWWVQLWGGPSKSGASGAPNGFWSETENPTVKVGYPKSLWFIEKKLIGHKTIQHRGSTYGMQNAMELWHLCLIVATHETSIAMRKASLNFAPAAKSDSPKYERSRLKRHVQCASDPSMIRPWPQEWTGQSAAQQLKLFCVLSRRTF